MNKCESVIVKVSVSLNPEESGMYKSENQDEGVQMPITEYVDDANHIHM